MKNVVVIGGGTGLSSMLAGMKSLKDVNLTAIVTVADDGGSTGRLRDVYDVPAVGDIRHVLTAMADTDAEDLFRSLLEYRFAGTEDVGGHQLGNLIFLALMDITGSFIGAIQAVSKILKVKGTILPSTLDSAILYALMKDGTLVRGEKNIPTQENSIEKVFYQQSITPYADAVAAIENADLIIYGLGSLYTSIMPNLIIKEISEAIYNNPCRRIYFCNAMSQPGETDGYSVEDHIRAIERHSFKNPVDLVVVNKAPLSEPTRIRYEAMHSRPVALRETDHTYEILERDLICTDENGRVRHDPKAVASVVQEILDGVEDHVVCQ